MFVGRLPRNVERTILKILLHTARFLRARDGASAAEYALILALLGGGMVAALWGLNGSVTGALNTTVSNIQGP